MTEARQERNHQREQPPVARRDRGWSDACRDRRDRRRRHAAPEVPRVLHAGRPGRARGADEEEAGEGVLVHDPAAAAGRRRDAGAVAEARRHRRHLCQRHAAADDAGDVPVSRRHQVELEADDAGDQRGVHRHDCRVRRRQSQRHVGVASVPVEGAQGSGKARRSRSAIICCRRRAPITRSGSTTRR